MSVKSLLFRGLRYIISGVPVVNVETKIVKLGWPQLLNGRNAIVTGGTSGIGYEIAEAFLDSGASVIITGRNLKRLEKSISKLKEKDENRKVSSLVLDNTDVKDIEEKIKNVLNEKDIDLLVNNAGIAGGSYSLDNCTKEDYQMVMDTNLRGTIFISRIISENMIRKNIKGNILNICSSSSLRPANTPYVLSKWGLRGYTLGLAKTLIKHGIVVNGLAPGPTATPMLLKQNVKNIALSQNPSGRYALPEEIANMAVVLTSDMGRMVVGDIVYMTGGSGVITFDDVNY